MDDPVSPGSVPVIIKPRVLGFPRKEQWQDPAYYTRFGGPRMDGHLEPFKFNPKDTRPLELQQMWHRYCTERDLGKLKFTHAYEKAFRHKNRFNWFRKRWKEPVVDYGRSLARRETQLREEYDAMRDRVMGVLEVKTAADFGGNGSPRQVA